MAEMWRSPQMVPRFVGFLSSFLQRVAETNDALWIHGGGGVPPCHHKVTVFHGLSKPGITVASYLERIFTYANCSPSCYVVAYIYLDRFSRRQPLVAVTSLTVHRLLITSVMVAAKFMDDVCYNNAFFAKVGGVSTLEMNFLERDFLFGLGFRLNVTPSVFGSYCAHLKREMLLEFPSPPLHCFLSDEEPSSASAVASAAGHQHQTQLAV
ncbi:unnamed protein product [Spirodela intermedia]|uniref:Uncharacterized protein n=1 Tax=Spirodela intermedia TaxID=51605 RepID=A0A7I8K871_SPIIN|nr:unnamed protein product [Spirodela intermedia]